MFVLRAQLWEARSAIRSPQMITEEELMQERRRVIFLTQKVEELERKLHQAPAASTTSIADDNPFRLNI